jgi:hypothetical protein
LLDIHPACRTESMAKVRITIEVKERLSERVGIAARIEPTY